MDKLVKRIAAITLVLALFLPLSQCSITPPPGQDSEVASSIVYAYSAYEWPSLGGFATFVAFLWPMLFVFFIKDKSNVYVYGLELLLSAGTGYMLVVLTYLGSWLFGAYVAALSICVYFVATLYQIAKQLKSKLQKN